MFLLFWLPVSDGRTNDGFSQIRRQLGDAIAKVKSTATKDKIEKCGDCKVLDYVNSPASEAAQLKPQLPRA